MDARQLDQLIRDSLIKLEITAGIPTTTTATATQQSPATITLRCGCTYVV